MGVISELTECRSDKVEKKSTTNNYLFNMPMKRNSMNAGIQRWLPHMSKGYLHYGALTKWPKV